MRPLLYLLLAAGIAACGHARDTGPAWPAASTTDEDGGESLEPRASSPVAAAIEDADEDEEEAADTDDAGSKTDDAAPAKTDSDQTAPSSEPTTDEPVMTEEIIIEIED